VKLNKKLLDQINLFRLLISSAGIRIQKGRKPILTGVAAFNCFDLLKQYY